MAPPGPPARASGSATTTHRGRALSPRTPATRRLQPPRAAACTRAHSAAAATGSARRPGLPGHAAASVAAAARTNPAARVRPRPPTDQRDVASVARVPASATVVEPSTARRPQGLHRFWWSGSPGHLLRWEETDASGRTGQTPDGWTGGQQTADRRTRWTTTPGDRTPDGWTAGSRTPKPDGWTPHAGH
jgi:hypothetical protein